MGSPMTSSMKARRPQRADRPGAKRLRVNMRATLVVLLMLVPLCLASSGAKRDGDTSAKRRSEDRRLNALRSAQRRNAQAEFDDSFANKRSSERSGWHFPTSGRLDPTLYPQQLPRSQQRSKAEQMAEIALSKAQRNAEARWKLIDKKFRSYQLSHKGVTWYYIKDPKTRKRVWRKDPVVSNKSAKPKAGEVSRSPSPESKSAQRRRLSTMDRLLKEIERAQSV